MGQPLFLMNERKPLSKRLRFTVFSRDGFTCRYCGRQSDQVQLVIDHIVPVCQGGTNDESNLITACNECNSGKGARTPEQAAPSESDRLRMAQETREQSEAFQKMKEALERKREVRQMIVDHFCSEKCVPTMSSKIATILVTLASQHGIEEVCDWISIACARMSSHDSDVKIMKYIYGIRRMRMANHEEVENE